MKVAVTGANGQLGKCLQNMANIMPKDENMKYYFLGHEDMDITKSESIEKALNDIRPDVVINCAAYTNVDKAEDDKDLCENINISGVRNLGSYCWKIDAFLIHISTDFVFDGDKDSPYTEDDICKPLSEYGSSKRIAEMTIGMGTPNYLIFRTSWLYSKYGKNFAKTMLSRIQTETKTNVVTDQIGTPTSADDLAFFLWELIRSKDYMGKHGIYHYSNEGSTTWYGFAKQIEFLDKGEDKNIISPCLTRAYPTKAIRPQYSVLSKDKLRRDFPWAYAYIPQWEYSLKEWYISMKNEK